MITFSCWRKGCSPDKWEGTLKIIKSGNPCEAEICARGSLFHLIAGKHAYGNYICIPNWNIGTELVSLSDTFWNDERLQTYSQMRKADACTIATALKVLADKDCFS